MTGSLIFVRQVRGSAMRDSRQRYLALAGLLAPLVMLLPPLGPAPPGASGSAYLDATRAARRAGDLRRAAWLLAEAERRGADPRGIAFEQLLLRAQRGEAAAVLPALTDRLVAVGPEAELAWEALGRGYLRAYRLREARGCFDELLAGNPNCLPGLLGRAATFREWPRAAWDSFPASKAVPDLRRAVAVAPWHAVARLWLIEGLAVSGNASEMWEAEHHFRAYLALRRGDPEGKARLAQALLRSIDTVHLRAARELLAAVVADRPRSTPALVLRARRARMEGREGEVLAWYLRALEADPFFREALWQVAMGLRSAGGQEQSDAALRRFQNVAGAEHRLDLLRAVMVGGGSGWDRRAPEDPGLRYEAGLAALRLGRREEARLWFERALIEDPGHGPARRALADHFGAGSGVGVAFDRLTP
jgi:tetratricopeptide (TPR) repeat protein